MTISKIVLPMAFVIAMCGAASANYFHIPGTTGTLNVGSAKSPTPADIHAAEDHLPGANAYDIKDLLGKPVFGRGGEYLGSVSDVDPDRKLAAVRISQNEAIALPATKLLDQKERVLAPSVSKGEFLSMPRIPDNELKG